MILRQAKLDDFEIFKELYEDKKGIYQFLYNSSKKEADTISIESSQIFDDSISELYTNYTVEQFAEDLKSSTLLYMIEDSSGVIGYITLFYCFSYNYKIEQWAMFNPKDINKKQDVIHCLKNLKLPRLRKLCICTINNEIEKFLISNGFYSTGVASFYSLDII